MNAQTTNRLMTGILSLRWGIYEITTSKNLRVGNEVMVARFDNENGVRLVTPSEAKRMTDQQRMMNGVTVLTVAKVERACIYGSKNAKRVHLHGASSTIDIWRTQPCIVRSV
jgi:hypothetical protein